MCGLISGQDIPVAQVANKFNRLIILGKPGSGKTTLLKYLALQNFEEESVLLKRSFPIFISLHKLSESKQTITEYINEEFDICNLPDSELFINEILKKGKAQILLDGLDEVREEFQDKIINNIIDFSDKFSGNQFIISCRVAAYNHWFTQFKDVEVADFDDKQIRNFIANWFSDESKIATECAEQIINNNPLKELGQSPLLLSMLCITYNEVYDFPSNRSELYKEAVDALLKKWDSTRRIKRGEVYRNISNKRKESLLSRIAIETFQNKQFFIPSKNIEKIIGKFIVNLPFVKEKDIEVDSPAILKSIESYHGLLVERAKRIYSFSHLTLQEYFAAKFIVDNSISGTVKQLVESYYNDKQWREVILLTTGMLEDALPFFELIKHNITEGVKESKILNLIYSKLGNESKNTEFWYPIDKIYNFLSLLSIIGDYYNSVDFDTNLYPTSYTKKYNSFLTSGSSLASIRAFEDKSSSFLGNSVQKLLLHCKNDLNISVLDNTSNILENLEVTKIEILIPDDFIEKNELKHEFDLVGEHLYQQYLFLEALFSDCYISKNDRLSFWRNYMHY